MTTLAVDTGRKYAISDFNEIPMIASDIIFEGAAVGVVDASGHARPLNVADRFVGFALEKADNASGSAADINVRVRKRGRIQLAVAGAVITDLQQPVYATDDNVFVFLPTAARFVGFVSQFISAGVVWVDFDVDNFVDPYAEWIAETHSAAQTLDITHNGKIFFVDTDAQTITLLTYAAATALHCKIVNIGPFGTVAVTVDPAAGDKIAGPDDTGADGGIATNTKATARRGDFIEIKSGGDDGYVITQKRGIWTIA